MLRRLTALVLPALIAIIFIVVTAIVSQSALSLSTFGRFCFLFHVIPFGFGFSGREGCAALMWLYYLVLWVMLTFFFFGSIQCIRLLLKPAK